jgi:hypothetical protein
LKEEAMISLLSGSIRPSRSRGAATFAVVSLGSTTLLAGGGRDNGPAPAKTMGPPVVAAAAHEQRAAAPASLTEGAFCNFYLPGVDTVLSSVGRRRGPNPLNEAHAHARLFDKRREAGASFSKRRLRNVL